MHGYAAEAASAHKFSAIKEGTPSLNRNYTEMVLQSALADSPC